jgi:hypothetical protein
MGLLTWIMATVVILFIIGQGWNVFVSGVFKGLEKVIVIVGPIIKDVNSQAKRYVDNIAGNNTIST